VFILGELESLRQRINETDKELVRFFLERMNLVSRVGEYKRSMNLEIYDPVREREIIERFTKDIKVEFNIKYLEQFLENLMFLSRNLQEDIIGRKQGAPR
jgi:monofunctional chorismate mutase